MERTMREARTSMRTAGFLNVISVPLGWACFGVFIAYVNGLGERGWEYVGVIFMWGPVLLIGSVLALLGGINALISPYERRGECLPSTGFIGGILCFAPTGIPACVLTVRGKKESIPVRLSDIHELASEDRALGTRDELQHLAELLSCPTCKFADQRARLQGTPWCNAPSPPNIERSYCYTFQQQN